MITDRTVLRYAHTNGQSYCYNIPAGCEGQADVVFVMDVSGSIGDGNFETMRAFMVELVDVLDVTSGNINVALITFSDDARLEFNLDRFNRK